MLTSLIDIVGTVGLWHWGRHLISNRKDLIHQQLSRARFVNVAGFGLLTATLLT